MQEMIVTNLIRGDWQPSNKHYNDNQRLGHQKTRGNGGRRGDGQIEKADSGGRWGA